MEAGRPAVRRRDLSVERVVDAAGELADRDGLEAVSMARVAERLGFTPMALYRHVSGKDELLQLMFDATVGEPPRSEDVASGAWRAGLERWARALLAILERHPWTLQVPISGPPTTPNRLAWFDRGLEALAESGLTEAEKAATILLVNGHVFWWARLARDVGATPGPPISPDEIDRYPALRRALEAGILEDQTDDFTWGLERILDGVEQVTARRG